MRRWVCAAVAAVTAGCPVVGVVGATAPERAPGPPVGADAGTPPPVVARPLCAVRIASVNGVPPDGGMPSIEPLDDVRLSAAPSSPGPDAGAVVAWRWWLTDQPEQSTAALSSPDAETTGFVFADDVFGLDRAGAYRVAVQVTDDRGVESRNGCELRLQAIPSEELWLQLSWDASFGDVDLHLLRRTDDDRFCSGADVDGALAETCPGVTDGDCYYGNCRAPDVVDWDGDGAGGGAADPVLDIDDRDGFGPENISLASPGAGEYLVAVHGFSLPQPVDATVRVYLFGQLHAVFRGTVGPDAWWEVALVRWSDDDVPCVDDLGDAGAPCAP